MLSLCPQTTEGMHACMHACTHSGNQSCNHSCYHMQTGFDWAWSLKGKLPPMCVLMLPMLENMYLWCFVVCPKVYENSVPGGLGEIRAVWGGFSGDPWRFLSARSDSRMPSGHVCVISLGRVMGPGLGACGFKLYNCFFVYIGTLFLLKHVTWLWMPWVLKFEVWSSTRKHVDCKKSLL